MGKWLAIIQAILDILKTLPFQGGEVQAMDQGDMEAKVESALCDQHTSDAVSEALDVRVKPEDWKEIVPDIVRIIQFFFARRGR